MYCEEEARGSVFQHLYCKEVHNGFVFGLLHRTKVVCGFRFALMYCEEVLRGFRSEVLYREKVLGGSRFVLLQRRLESCRFRAELMNPDSGGGTMNVSQKTPVSASHGPVAPFSTKKRRVRQGADPPGV